MNSQTYNIIDKVSLHLQKKKNNHYILLSFISRASYRTTNQFQNPGLKTSGKEIKKK